MFEFGDAGRGESDCEPPDCGCGTLDSSCTSEAIAVGDVVEGYGSTRLVVACDDQHLREVVFVTKYCTTEIESTMTIRFIFYKLNGLI